MISFSLKYKSQNKKYRPVYKCLLCGQMISHKKESIEIPYDKLPELLGRVVRNQQFIGNPYLYEAPMQIPHKCDDGSAGFAQFAGFKLSS